MKDTCILGLHIAKTGGTSILYNFGTHLDRSAFMNYGPKSNVDRFFRGEPLFENMDPDKLLNYQFVFGHGVHEGLLQTLPHDDVVLFCVFRDPYLHLLSHYKHKTRLGAMDGVSVSPKTFLKQRPDNPASRYLVSHFPTLAGEGDLRTQTLNVLKHFRFVFSTDNLNQQSTELFRMADLPPIKAKRRVYPETVELPDLTREDVYAANAVDYEVNQAINAMRDDPSKVESWNPYGYDPDALANAREQLRASKLDDENNPSPETKLAKQLQQKKSVLAAQEFARQNEMTGEMASILETLPTKSSTPLIQSTEQSNLGRVLNKGGKPQDAIEALEKAIELNAGNVNAHYQLSLVYFGLHNKREAHSDEDYLAKSLVRAEEASKRAPNRGDVEAHIGDIYLARKDLKNAFTHFKRAVKLSPDNDGLRLKYNELKRHPILNWFIRRGTKS